VAGRNKDLPFPDAEPDTISTEQTPGPGGTNPFDQGRSGTTGGTGSVGPSAPTTGTEGGALGPNRGSGPIRSGGPAQREDSAGSRDFVSERDQQPVGERTFRCADAGNADCRWETTARTDDEMMGQVERHEREEHGITSFDDATRRKYMNAVRERRAA
jgi:predicted small metal-binding protein